MNVGVSIQLAQVLPAQLLPAQLLPAQLRMAQLGGEAPQGNPFAPLLVIGAFVLVFYAFVIRPQRQQEKQQREMRESLKRGDQVVTSGGLHGRITGLSDDVVTVEVADRVRVKVSRVAIASARSQAGSAQGEGAGEGKA